MAPSATSKVPKENNGMVRGINAGFKVTPIAPRVKPSHRKGQNSEAKMLVRSIVAETVGLAPYQRRTIELIKNGRDKRARKLLKARVGTMSRAKRMMDKMNTVIQQSRTAH